jgi:nitroimidazol reductase NimA-like FMN-containing flavoprotein (pyridoxamine 5'-phosphate oxidase superfamily)
MTPAERARQTLETVINGSVATVCVDGRPWNTPLYFAFDQNLTFYWRSRVEAVHSRNIATCPDVLLVIFDSTRPDDTGHAVYVRGRARELRDEASIATALQCLAARRNESPPPAGEFMPPQPRRVYEAVASEVWTNVVQERDGHIVDERVTVDLLPRR